MRELTQLHLDYNGDFKRVAQAIDHYAEDFVLPAYARAVGDVMETTLRFLVSGGHKGKDPEKSQYHNVGVAGRGTPQWSGHLVRNWRITGTTAVAPGPDKIQLDKIEALYDRITDFLEGVTRSLDQAMLLQEMVYANHDFWAGLAHNSGTQDFDPDNLFHIGRLARLTLKFYERYGYYPELFVRAYTTSRGKQEPFPKSTDHERVAQQTVAMRYNDPLIQRLHDPLWLKQEAGKELVRNIAFTNPVVYPKLGPLRWQNRPITTLTQASQKAGEYAEWRLTKAQKEYEKEAQQLFGRWMR